MSDKMKRLTRRGFLGASGTIVGGMAVANLQLEAAPERTTGTDSPPVKWDESWDVVVVGSGFAGLSAAIEARNAGASVLVIEKMPVYGGNSIINGGDFAAPGNRFQKEVGIKDSSEQMLKDMLKAGNGINHPELARTVAEKAMDALEWAQTYIGARFTHLNFHGGHSVKRSVQTINQSGSELVNKLLTKAVSLSVQVVMRTKLTRIITGQDGRVLGIEVCKGYKWPDDASGTIARIKASRAVVLATGGFSQDLPLRQIHDPRLTHEFGSTNQPGATGEALLAACRAGAMDVQMDCIQLGPWTSPDEPGFGRTPQVCEPIVGYGLMVDPATGKRFFKETGNRKERADAIIAIGHPVVILGDATAVGGQVAPKVLRKAMEGGAVKCFDTLEDLARAYGIPVRSFLDEVARWNGFVEKNRDLDFDCMIFPDAKLTVQPPFYGMRLWPRVHHTMGGMVIDKEARVKSFDLKPIPGLYAAGEVTGGVHGAVRLGSVAMTDCIVFGRIAGRNAGREKAWSQTCTPSEQMENEFL